jgi:subtilisin family serine protease
MDGGLPEVAIDAEIAEFGAPTAASANDFPGGLPPGPDAGSGVRVGIVDTPMSVSAQQALGLRKAISLVHFEDSNSYRAGHSEFVASLIRRQAPAALLYLASVIDPDSGRANSWKTAQAIMRLAVEDEIDILNLSLGCFAATGPPFVITRAIEKISPRVLVVAAAGNHGAIDKWVMNRTSKSAVWPAAIPPAISVGAHDGHGQTPPAWSPNLSWVACTAPGVDVVGRYLHGPVELLGEQQEFHGFARWSGTSFAAATVTGAIAAQTGPGSDPRAAFEHLRSSGGVVREFTPVVTAGSA